MLQTLRGNKRIKLQMLAMKFNVLMNLMRMKFQRKTPQLVKFKTVLTNSNNDFKLFLGSR